MSEVVPLVQRIAQKHGGSLACCFHVLFEDGNYERCFVESSLKNATLNGHRECIELAYILCGMSLTQISKIGSTYWKKVRT